MAAKPVTGKTLTEIEAALTTSRDPVRPQDLLPILEQLSKIVVGTIEIANGVNTGTQSVGSEFNGKPVFACLNEVDGVVTVAAAVVSAGTLTVTLSANTTGIRTCRFVIFGSTFDPTV